VIVLDTNVLSELMKPIPASEVLRWMASQPASKLFLTSVTQAEILYGIELLAKGRRRMALESAIKAILEEDFAGRILPFDGDAAFVFPQIVAARRDLGSPITQWDAQIAAIARSRGAALATRNTSDFEHCGISVLNPWDKP
jgi:predicted nucleic acid-binding protein